MGRRRGESRFRAGDAPEHDGALADKNLQNLPFEPAVAKRHAPEMVLIDDGRLAIPAGHSQARSGHYVLPVDQTIAIGRDFAR